ncbi:MAG: peptidoglycan-binding domain-containing protein [bacterium]|nr:peptidoglycan-binding domain-containing protein [bacterium]
MKNKIILSLLLVCALAIPVFTKAVSVDDLRALIAQLQAQIQALQAQLQQTQGQQPVKWCHTFNTNLGIGSSGTEFDALQTALMKDGASGESLSYDSAGMGQSSKFGEYTASAVVAFQQKYASEILTPLGLKYGTGYLGNSTRAKLNKIYGCGQPVITPQPVSCVKEGEQTANTAVASIRKCCSGLSLIEEMTNFNSNCTKEPMLNKITYTCTACGNGVCGPGENRCNCPSDCNTTITPATCTDSDGYKNFSTKGKAFGRLMGETKWWEDYCVSTNTVYDFTCKTNVDSTSNSIDAVADSYVCPNGCSNGACIASSAGNLPPVIDGVTAPTQLKVNEQGTWVIRAHDPENGYLNYSVNWGDTGSASGQSIQTNTLQHSYSKAGTYTITITITDDKNKSTNTSSTVKVVENIIGTSQIVNGIDIMKEGVPGDFYAPEGGGTYNLEVNNIQNNFYSNHEDNYDFLVVFLLKPSHTSSLMINKSGETIGTDFGSYDSPSKKLKSFVSIGISGLIQSGANVVDFEQWNMGTYLSALAHELSHHWLAYIPWEGMKSGHYANMPDLFSGSLLYSDPMQYDHWVSTTSGKVCIDHNGKDSIPKFSNLSLYLMGLIPKTSVLPIPVIQTSVEYPMGEPNCTQATNFLDTIKTYTINDILTLAGKDRVPAYPNTQRDFKIGYIVLVPANDSGSSSSIQLASDIVNQFTQYWSSVTNNLSNVSK